MKLRMEKGASPGQVIPLNDDLFMIGRVNDNDLVIAEGGVSRHHCRLSRIDGEWMVEDLQSVNGVMVNGRRIDGGTVLHAGDRMTVFNHTFILEEDDNTAAPTPLAALPQQAPLTLKPDLKPEAPAHKVPRRDQEIFRQTLVEQPETATLPAMPAPPDLAEYDDRTNRSSSAPRPATGILILKGLVLAGIIALIIVLLSILVTETGKKTATDGDVPATEAQAQNGDNPSDTSPEAAERPETQQDNSMNASDASNGAATTSASTEKAPAAPESATSQSSADATNTSGTESADNRPLAIRTFPAGAAVSLDGTFCGNSPMIIENMARGYHTLEVSLKGYKPLKRQFNVPRNLPAMPLNLVQKPGTLAVSTQPAGATVREGRIIHGTTPLVIENLSSGTHELLLELAGHEPKKISATLTAAKGEAVQEYLERVLGELRVSTTPAGCQVYLDGILMGTTESQPGTLESKPLHLASLLPGTCTVSVTHPATGITQNQQYQLKRNTASALRIFLWVPTHSIAFINGDQLNAMVQSQDDEKIVVMNPDGKTAVYPRSTIAYNFELNAQEQKEASIKGKTEPRGANHPKTSLNALLFIAKADSEEYAEKCLGKTISITGDISARLSMPSGMRCVQFSARLQCFLKPDTAAQDYKTIGELDKKGKTITLTGTYAGRDQNGRHLMKNCVLMDNSD